MSGQAGSSSGFDCVFIPCSNTFRHFKPGCFLKFKDISSSFFFFLMLVLVSFSLLGQEIGDGPLINEEILILAHGFRGFCPCLFSLVP